MKSIYFNKYNSWQNGLLIIPGAFFVLLAGLHMLLDFSAEYAKIFGILGNFFLAIYWGKMFVFKYYVGWNKLGMNMKIDSFWFKTFSFDKVSNFSLEKDRLKIFLMDGKEYRFCLKNIKMQDRQRLLKILEEKTLKSAGSHT